MTFKFLIIILLAGPILGRAQTVQFAGTYVNLSGTISLRFKPVANAFHGLLLTTGGNFAMKATVKNGQMAGVIYAVNGPADFTAVPAPNGMVFTSFGYSETFFLFNADHGLANVDLTPYLKEGNAPIGAGSDFDYSYSQHSPGGATENRQNYPAQKPVNSPYPEYKDAELLKIISGSQVVYYTRTSYVNDNTASTITYVNFCPNGTFTLNYDGSFSVEGDYGDNAQGASYGQHSGIWKLVSYQGQPAVFMAFGNGNTGLNPVNKSLLLQGRWRIGNTQYAIQRNKVTCR